MKPWREMVSRKKIYMHTLSGTFSMICARACGLFIWLGMSIVLLASQHKSQVYAYFQDRLQMVFALQSLDWQVTNLIRGSVRECHGTLWELLLFFHVLLEFLCIFHLLIRYKVVVFSKLGILPYPPSSTLVGQWFKFLIWL